MKINILINCGLDAGGYRPMIYINILALGTKSQTIQQSLLEITVPLLWQAGIGPQLPQLSISSCHFWFYVVRIGRIVDGYISGDNECGWIAGGLWMRIADADEEIGYPTHL